MYFCVQCEIGNLILYFAYGSPIAPAPFVKYPIFHLIYNAALPQTVSIMHDFQFSIVLTNHCFTLELISHCFNHHRYKKVPLPSSSKLSSGSQSCSFPHVFLFLFFSLTVKLSFAFDCNGY